MHGSMLSECIKNKELLLLIKWTISSFTAKALPYDEVSIYKSYYLLLCSVIQSEHCYMIFRKYVFCFSHYVNFCLWEDDPHSLSICIHRYNEDDEWDDSEIIFWYEDKRTSNFTLLRFLSSRICMTLSDQVRSISRSKIQGMTCTYNFHKKARLCFSHRKIIFN